MTEVTCPADGCDYSSNSKRGVSIHFSSQHPEQEYDFSSKETYSCDFCNDSFKRYSYRVTGKNVFCSNNCKDKFEAKDGLDTECAECGEDIHIPPSRAEKVGGYEQKNHFCDKECESSFKSREWVKENHPSWDGGRVRVTCKECSGTYSVHPNELEETSFCSIECMRKNWKVDEEEYNCANCGGIVTKKPYNVRGENTTCSKQCHKEFMRSIRKGEDNPCWNGGLFGYYGPNWPEQREKALERDDYECQECGMTIDEHIDKFDQELHVHHKVKRRQIIDVNNPTMDQFELANSLDNLVAVCNGCHKKLEHQNHGNRISRHGDV